MIEWGTFLDEHPHGFIFGIFNSAFNSTTNNKQQSKLT